MNRCLPNVESDGQNDGCSHEYGTKDGNNFHLDVDGFL